MIEIWTERLAGTMAGGRALMAVYADHVYLGTLACPDGVADEVRAALHLPDKLVGMHQPCHEPDVARELCTHRKHVGRDEGGVLCRECGRTYPCATVRLATPASVTGPAGVLLMGEPGGGKVDGQALLEAEHAARLPHSRACGIRQHTHGVECATDCPTCQGQRWTPPPQEPLPIRATPPTMEQAQGWTHWVPQGGGPTGGTTACGYELRRDDGVSYTTEPDRVEDGEVTCPWCLTAERREYEQDLAIQEGR